MEYTGGYPIKTSDIYGLDATIPVQVEIACFMDWVGFVHNIVSEEEFAQTV